MRFFQTAGNETPHTYKTKFKPLIDIKGMKQQQKGAVLKDFFVMGDNSDPFKTGTNAHWEKALWFLEVWKKATEAGKVHLRKIHYRLLHSHKNGEAPALWDGTEYDGTNEQWQKIQEASRHARALGLINPLELNDRKNKAKIYHEASTPEVHIHAGERGGMSIPEIRGNFYIEFQKPSIGAYGMGEGAQPINLAIFIEKSGDVEMIDGICKRYGIDLVVGEGFISITQCAEAVDRAIRNQKELIILYISDFDPSGFTMVQQVARHIEYECRMRSAEGDQVPRIRVHPIALSMEQALDLDIPLMKLKEGDKKVPGFIERFGIDKGAEVDALEFLHPGSLKKIIMDAVMPLRDNDYNKKVASLLTENRQRLQDAWEDATADLHPAMDELEDATERLRETMAPLIEEFERVMREEAAPLQERAREIMDELEVRADNLSIDLDVPVPEHPEPEINWYMDSERDYMEQIERYKSYKGGE